MKGVRKRENGKRDRKSVLREENEGRRKIEMKLFWIKVRRSSWERAFWWFFLWERMKKEECELNGIEEKELER